MSHPVPPSAAVTAGVLIEQLHEYIDTAHEVLRQGDYVALTDFNVWVEELCKCVTGMPVDEAVLYRDELQQLMDSLDDLKGEMERHKTSLGEQMGGLQHSQKAAKAYKKSSHMGLAKPDAPDEGDVR
jgi:hypothetical protein